MRTIHHFATTICMLCACFLSLSAEATVPADLIKVTPATNPTCVEYVTYKNAMYCTTKQTQQATINPAIKNYETQQIVFDERPWQAAWGKQADDISTVEYVPFGESIDNWNELITSQYMPKIPQSVTPKEFADLSIQNIKDAGFALQINFYENTPTQVLYEFRIVTPSNQVQDEIQLVRKNANGFYALHYVIKKADMGETERKKWLNLLLQSKLTK